MFQKNILPPQAGMPHALNPNFPPLSEINIEIPSEPSTFESPVSQPRRILLNNFDAAVSHLSWIGHIITLSTNTHIGWQRLYLTRGLWQQYGQEERSTSASYCGYFL